MSSTNSLTIDKLAQFEDNCCASSGAIEISSDNLHKLNRQSLVDMSMDAILPWMKGFDKRYHPVEYEHDIVKCICGFSCPDSEETREMVQCDQCGNWQHIPCLKLKKDDIPLDYFCHHCLPERHAHLISSRAPQGPAHKARALKKIKLSAVTKDRVQASRQVKTLTRTRSARYNTTSVQSADDLDLDDDLKIMKTSSNHSQNRISVRTDEFVEPYARDETSSATFVGNSSEFGTSKQVSSTESPRRSQGSKRELSPEDGRHSSGRLENAPRRRTVLDHESEDSLEGITPASFIQSLGIDQAIFSSMLKMASMKLMEYHFDLPKGDISWKAWASLNSSTLNQARLDLESRYPTLCNGLSKHASSWLLYHCYSTSLTVSHTVARSPNIATKPKQTELLDSQITFKVTKLPRMMDTKGDLPTNHRH